MPASITRVAPLWAVDGGTLLVEGDELPYDPPPRVTIADAPAHVAAASPRHLRIVVPPELEGGRVPLRVDAVPGGTVLIDVGATLATGVHQVDNPAFDRDGNVYATFSGSRENRVPVTLFRVRRDGVREPIRVDIPNPTSVAIGRDGALYVSFLTGFPFPEGGSRIEAWSPEGELLATYEGLTGVVGLLVTDDGTIYATQHGVFGDEGWAADSGSVVMVTADSGITPIAEGLNVPFGLAQDADGNLAVAVNSASEAGTGQIISIPAAM